MKTWKPDTCKCNIEEIYDNGEPIGMGTIITKCESHKDVDDSDLYNVIIRNVDSDQKRKNQTCNDIVAQHQYTLSDQEKTLLKLLSRLNGNDNGEINIPDSVFDPDKSFSWEFDADRKLIVTTKGFTNAEKNTIQDDKSAKFGSGKVEVL